MGAGLSRGIRREAQLRSGCTVRRPRNPGKGRMDRCLDARCARHREPRTVGVWWADVATGVDPSGCLEEMRLGLARSHIRTLEGRTDGG